MKSPDFDPYHSWLAIPKEFRPPNLYQLLGISPTETLQKVIETAALRQSAFLRSFQTGEHAEWANQILSEIAEARAVLLDPKRRKEYDAKLQRNAPITNALSSPKVEVVPEVTVERIRTKPDSNVRISAPHSKDSYGLSRKSKTSSPTDDVEVVEEVETEILYSPGRRRGNTSSIRRKGIDPVLGWSIGGGAAVIVVTISIFLLRSATHKTSDVRTESPPIPELALNSNGGQPNAGSGNPKTNSPDPTDRSHQLETDRLKQLDIARKEQAKKEPNSDANAKKKPEEPKVEEIPIVRPSLIRNRTIEFDGVKKLVVLQPRNEVENEWIIDEALAILAEVDDTYHAAALQHLAVCLPNHRTKEVIRQALKHAEKQSDVALSIISNWDPVHAYENLRPLLKDEELSGAMIVALGKSRDARALEPMVKALSTLQTRDDAVNGFIAYGPGGEDVILNLESDAVEKKDKELRLALYSILKEIGGKKSLARLKEITPLIRNRKLDFEIWRAANDAETAIKKRQ